MTRQGKTGSGHPGDPPEQGWVAQGLDLTAYRAWIGRDEIGSDVLAVEMLKRFAATLDLAPPNLRQGCPAPAGIHWCLAPPAMPTASLSTDGHARRGDFLPPIPLPRRMWAGGALTFGPPICVGDEVRRRSSIRDVAVKSGRTGPLCFVTVQHELQVGLVSVVSERQDIVFRAARAEGQTGITREAVAMPEAQRCRSVQADAPLLFRYSALTFNSHRVHYDRQYCSEDEGYPGLVIHGPLQATLLLQFATEIQGGCAPATFSFRSVAPLFDGAAFQLCAAEAAGGLQLWTADREGKSAMVAEAVW